ncbi:putative 2-keto-3-deoxy-galactonate aldolase YagE [Streptomyces sp. YIM 130001]|uniref:dihydrodipicolinate synthase family protein n=1 Tax=Streptomyces sp. YIM 130001 TaxID=2259644 RepID=UPI000E653266|nr:dihydrodipicolinate synthase family protein [Streptomyces sp. YIM 130001]RII17874.1 putative 2-keto-3-deoxy-galactonate aldolase YagE [Streptomyces sp. YIM 130001]
MNDATSLLGGVTTPLITPMDETGRPAADRTAPLLGALADAGIDKLMLLGSNGEGPLLPTSVIGPFLERAVRQWRSLAPGGVATVNVTAGGTLEALERAELAAAAGADALVMSPPIYFQHRDDEIVAHYAALASIGLPVIAYNAPRYSNPLTHDVIDALLDLDHLAGIKDSSGDIDLFGHLVERARTRPGFEVSQGAETHLAAALELGAHGIVPGIANISPALSLQLTAAHRAGDRDEMHRLQALVTELTKLHAIRRGTPGVKEILAQLRLCPPYVAPPLLRCEPDERHAFQEFITAHKEQLIRPTKG